MVNKNTVRTFLIVAVLLYSLSGCLISTPQKHVFSANDVVNKFYWDDNAALNRVLNTSDSGIYVALENDSLNFEKKITFGNLHNFYSSQHRSPEDDINYGIYEIHDDSISVEIIHYYFPWHRLAFHIENRNRIVLIDSLNPSDSTVFIFYDFNQPVRMDYCPYLEEEVLWKTPDDYKRWQNSPKSYISSKQ